MPIYGELSLENKEDVEKDMVMIIHDSFCPHIDYNDPYGRFLVMEVKYFEDLIWLIGIYAPNNANQCIELWSSIYP